jgi:hypothetical protein
MKEICGNLCIESVIICEKLKKRFSLIYADQDIDNR